MKHFLCSSTIVYFAISGSLSVFRYSRFHASIHLEIKHTVTNVKSEVFTAVRMMFFWLSVPCRLVDRCQRFGGTYCLHLQGSLKMETVCFFRNAGIYLRVYTAPKPRRITYNDTCSQTIRSIRVTAQVSVAVRVWACN
jgi:hypothetical protein